MRLTQHEIAVLNDIIQRALEDAEQADLDEQVAQIDSWSEERRDTNMVSLIVIGIAAIGAAGMVLLAWGI